MQNSGNSRNRITAQDDHGNLSVGAVANHLQGCPDRWQRKALCKYRTDRKH